MRIVSVDGRSACCEAKGVRREIRLDLLDVEVGVGDYVLIHAGYALQTMTEADARTTWDLFDLMTSAFDRAGVSTQRGPNLPGLIKEKIQ